MNKYIQSSFNISKTIIKKDIKFFPCSRTPCYCKMIINYPQNTAITPTLIKNANKCRKEYHLFNKR